MTMEAKHTPGADVAMNYAAWRGAIQREVERAGGQMPSTANWSEMWEAGLSFREVATSITKATGAGQ